ncbi:Hsp70 protein that interacts with Zuo1p [Tulasnella sp. 331]|nr:Hsp70 protein that interacts with Zuo1p [Tulasnella sp. 331]KAG8870559.1 Hsp70 protein that interacts with Zuo1p [Tulasnella sp. 332]
MSAAAPNGTSKFETVIGINFGDNYASIAVINKENQPECIANEDGERQIACAISYNGQELYVGNGAKPQLVKNAKNTISHFRNLLGKKYSHLKPSHRELSAPLVLGPNDTPAYTITRPVSTSMSLAPGTATPRSKAPSKKPTPAGTPRPTSPSSQTETVTITVPEAATMILRSLKESAVDFIGKDIDGAVIGVPYWFDAEARSALQSAAKDAGLNVLQLVDEAGAVGVAYADHPNQSRVNNNDLTQLVVDMGAGSLTLTLLSNKQGIMHTLATLHDPKLGGDSIDDILITYFGKEFTKKTKIAVHLCPAKTPEDKRAEAKMRLAVESTKRTLSASSGAASCAVESLKDGFDFSGSITRLRFDLLVGKVYKHVAEKVREILKHSGVDIVHVDEILLAGATTRLPGLADELVTSVIGLSEENQKTTRIRVDIEPSEVIALGCVSQARLVGLQVEGEEREKAFGKDAEGVTKVSATAKPIGMLFHQADGSKPWFPLIYAHSPLPVRRLIRMNVAPGAKKVAFDVWEGEDHVEVKKPAKMANADDDEEEEEERSRAVHEKTNLGGLALDLKAGGAAAKVVVKAEVAVDGAVTVQLWEDGHDEPSSRKELKVAAPS